MIVNDIAARQIALAHEAALRDDKERETQRRAVQDFADRLSRGELKPMLDDSGYPRDGVFIDADFNVVHRPRFRF